MSSVLRLLDRGSKWWFQPVLIQVGRAQRLDLQLRYFCERQWQTDRLTDRWTTKKKKKVCVKKNQEDCSSKTKETIRCNIWTLNRSWFEKATIKDCLNMDQILHVRKLLISLDVILFADIACLSITCHNVCNYSQMATKYVLCRDRIHWVGLHPLTIDVFKS